MKAMDGRQTWTAAGKTRKFRLVSLAFPPDINNSVATTHPSSTRPYRRWFRGIVASPLTRLVSVEVHDGTVV